VCFSVAGVKVEYPALHVKADAEPATHSRRSA
jgi:hypothetical protein